MCIYIYMSKYEGRKVERLRDLVLKLLSCTAPFAKVAKGLWLSSWKQPNLWAFQGSKWCESLTISKLLPLFYCHLSVLFVIWVSEVCVPSSLFWWWRAASSALIPVSRNRSEDVWRDGPVVATWKENLSAYPCSRSRLLRSIKRVTEDLTELKCESASSFESIWEWACIETKYVKSTFQRGSVFGENWLLKVLLVHVCTVVRQFSCAHCGIQTSPRSKERRVSEKTCVQSCWWRGGERERKVWDITFFEVNSSSILYFQYVSSAERGQSHVSLRTSLRDSQWALSGDDLKIFMGLLSDLFPSVEVGHGARKNERIEKTWTILNEQYWTYIYTI